MVLVRVGGGLNISYSPYLVRYLKGNVPPDNFILNGTAMWDLELLDQIRADLGADDSLA